MSYGLLAALFAFGILTVLAYDLWSITTMLVGLYGGSCVFFAITVLLAGIGILISSGVLLTISLVNHVAG